MSTIKETATLSERLQGIIHDLKSFDLRYPKMLTKDVVKLIKAIAEWQSQQEPTAMKPFNMWSKYKDAGELARKFHSYYEKLAPHYGYETREETREFKPDTPNGKLMIAVCEQILSEPIAEQPIVTEGESYADKIENLAFQLPIDKDKIIKQLMEENIAFKSKLSQPTPTDSEIKTGTQILFEHGINIMELNDDFNSQLLAAMERYSEQKSQPTPTDSEHAIKLLLKHNAELINERNLLKAKLTLTDEQIEQMAVAEYPFGETDKVYTYWDRNAFIKGAKAILNYKP